MSNPFDTDPELMAVIQAAVAPLQAAAPLFEAAMQRAPGAGAQVYAERGLSASTALNMVGLAFPDLEPLMAKLAVAADRGVSAFSAALMEAQGSPDSAAVTNPASAAPVIDRAAIERMWNPSPPTARAAGRPQPAPAAQPAASAPTLDPATIYARFNPKPPGR